MKEGHRGLGSWAQRRIWPPAEGREPLLPYTVDKEVRMIVDIDGFVGGVLEN